MADASSSSISAAIPVAENEEDGIRGFLSSRYFSLAKLFYIELAQLQSFTQSWGFPYSPNYQDLMACEAWRQGVKLGMLDLWFKRDFADMKVKCGDETFEVHKAIVCAQSEFFKRAFKADMTVSLSSGAKRPAEISSCFGFFKIQKTECEQEKASGTIELVGEAPETISAMLQYMYTGTYQTKLLPFSSMLFHVSLYQAADKYQVNHMKSDVAAKFKTSSNEAFRMHSDMDSVHQRAALEEKIISAINELYDSTPPSDRGLRDAVVESFNTVYPKSKLQRALGILNSRKTFREEILVRWASRLDQEATGQIFSCSCGAKAKLLFMPSINSPGSPYCPHCGRRSRESSQILNLGMPLR